MKVNIIDLEFSREINANDAYVLFSSNEERYICFLHKKGESSYTIQFGNLNQIISAIQCMNTYTDLVIKRSSDCDFGSSGKSCMQHIKRIIAHLF